MVSDHINYLTFEDPGAVNTVRRALKLAHAGDLYGAAETAGVDVAHAATVSEGLRRGMRFSIGAEVDNDPRARPDAQNIVDAMRPDGIVRTVHFLAIDHPEKGGEWFWPFDNPEFVQVYDIVGVEKTWELYMARLLDDIEKLPGHIVGHFYVPAKFGHWPDDEKLKQYEDQVLDACLARGMAIEINTRFLYRDHSPEEKARYREVNERLMRKAKAKGVPIAIGSDAHSPKDQGGAFDVVLQMLDASDINELVFPVGGRLARVALRATREHIEAQQKQQEPVQPGSSISGFGRAELGLPEEALAAQGEEFEKATKSGRDVGPKKRTTGPSRTTKGPEAESAPSPKSSSRRSAESAASSAKAKSDKATEPLEEPVVEAPAAAEAETVKPAQKATPTKTASKTAKPATKTVAAKTSATKAKAPSSTKALKPAAKTNAKSTSKTTAKPAAKSSAKPAAAKSTAAKKTAVKKAPAAAKKAAAKKTPVKAAPKAKKPAAKAIVKKSAPKKAATSAKPVKKTAKPSAKGTATKKKTSTKRR